jgi:hypothetical protein
VILNLPRVLRPRPLLTAALIERRCGGRRGVSETPS